jgi:predicted esterase
MAAPPVVIAPKSAHSATVVWLHGLGDSGNGWAPIAHEIALPHVKWVFPNAPARPVTINGGTAMPAWADIIALSLEAPEDEEGTMATRSMIHGIIADEVKAGVPANRIVIGGFSQGAAMACVAALSHEQPLAGCFVLSGYLTLRNKIPNMLTDGGRATPFFQAHGTQDMVVPFMFGQISSQLISSFGVKSSFKDYAMGHTSCAQVYPVVSVLLHDYAHGARRTCPP